MRFKDGEWDDLVKRISKMENKKNKKVSLKKKDLPECSICCDLYEKSDQFSCPSCKFEHCKKCLKTYLLETTQEQHCMNCKTVLPYENFMEMTDKTWRLGTYKKHREKILWDREISRLPEAMLEIQKKSEIKKLSTELRELKEAFELKENAILRKIRRIQMNQPPEGEDEEEVVLTKKKPTHYEWTQACPKEGCRGFLDKKYECCVCDDKYCKDCFISIKDEDPEEPHTCDKDLVETYKEIRNSAKPCPGCGEFIGKISGCDQMFCTGCGTAFSWNTGQKETGLIHNPHAHQFFQNNPEALAIYNGRRAGGRRDDGCRDIIPDYGALRTLPLSREWIQKINEEYRTYVFNVHHYTLRDIQRKINDEHDNLDLRIRYIENEIDEASFKRTLHAREKKLNYIKQIYPILRITYELYSNYIWSFVDKQNEEEFKKKKKEEQEMELLKMIDSMHLLREETNDIFLRISTDFGYKSSFFIENNLHLVGNF